MNLLHLQYFYVVAKEQGFTNASQALKIQQPAISRMVKLLEADIGFPLFERIGRNVRLTSKGNEVFEHCKRIFGAVSQLQESLGHIEGTLKGPVLFGASEPIASHYVPAVLGKYMKQYPQVYPNMYSGPAADLFGRLVKGDLSFGMFFHTPDLPDALEVFKAIDIPYHLVVRKDLRRSRDTLESFIGSREIDDTSTKRFPTLERLRKDYPGATIRISSNNLTAHRSMVLQGLGVSILPGFLVGQDLKEGTLASVYPEDIHYKLKFIKRRTAVLPLSAMKFVDSCT